jgi:hypothetical protein
MLAATCVGGIKPLPCPCCQHYHDTDVARMACKLCTEQQYLHVPRHLKRQAAGQLSSKILTHADLQTQHVHAQAHKPPIPLEQSHKAAGSQYVMGRTARRGAPLQHKNRATRTNTHRPMPKATPQRIRGCPTAPGSTRGVNCCA